MRTSLTLLAALILMLAAAAPAAAAGTRGATLSVAFPSDAKLGAEAPVRLRLAIDPRQLQKPVRQLQLRFPAALGIATSGLGAATCRRSAEEFAAVMIAGTGLAGCPPNALMGRGTARAEVRLGARERADALVIPEIANVAMLAAPARSDRFGLVFIANGLKPFGVTLAYDGHIAPAPPPFGGALVMDLRPVPNQFDADVALTAIDFEIGADDIRYRAPGSDGAWYQPEGIVLPDRCPRTGLLFHATLTFADGSNADTRTTARCPRAGARHRAT